MEYDYLFMYPKDVMKDIFFYFKNNVLYYFVSFLSLLFVVGCESKVYTNNFFEAQKCIEKKEWSTAERHLELYLREEETVTLRFDAWNTLLKVGQNLNYDDNWMLGCLEEMYSEFEEQPEQVKSVLWLLASVYDRVRNYERAVESWEKLLRQPDLLPEQQATILRNLALVNIRLHRFDTADSCLNLCLELPINEGIKLECLLDKADVASSREFFDDGVHYARLVLESEEASPELKGKAGFILADIKEQQGNIQNAIEVFTSIREMYPNEMVVEQRLQLLQAKNKH